MYVKVKLIKFLVGSMMMITYEYWIIDRLVNDHYELYAYTDNKVYKKRFVKERNPDIFKITKYNLDKQDIHNLTEEHMGQYLTTLEGKTHVGDTTRDFSLIVTKNELLNINSLIHQWYMIDLWRLCTLNPYFLKSKYYEALKALDYVSAYDEIHNSDQNVSINWFTHREPDYFGAFVKLYGDMLRNEGNK